MMEKLWTSEREKKRRKKTQQVAASEKGAPRKVSISNI